MSRTGDINYRKKRAECLAPDNLVCALCHQPIDKTLEWPDPMSATADHIIPVARGGRNDGQLQPAHKLCNEKKRSGDNFVQTSRDWLA